jgi:hypothetical protein
MRDYYTVPSVFSCSTRRTNCSFNRELRRRSLFLCFGRTLCALIPFSLRRKVTPSSTHPITCLHSADGTRLDKQPEMEEANQMGVKRAAIRKLEHELGVTPDQVPIEKFQFLTRILYKAASDEIWGEHESMPLVWSRSVHTDSMTQSTTSFSFARM